MSLRNHGPVPSPARKRGRMEPKKSTVRTLRDIHDEVHAKLEASKRKQLDEVMETFKKELPRHRASLLELARFDIYPYGDSARVSVTIEQERLPSGVKELLQRAGKEHKRVNDELYAVRSKRYNVDLLEILRKRDPELVRRVEDSLQQAMLEEITNLKG